MENLWHTSSITCKLNMELIWVMFTLSDSVWEHMCNFGMNWIFLNIWKLNFFRAGVAGSVLQYLSEKKAGRITGLGKFLKILNFSCKLMINSSYRSSLPLCNLNFFNHWKFINSLKFKVWGYIKHKHNVGLIRCCLCG